MDPRSAVAQSAGLVAAYGFNEGSGSTVADASGNGNAGTISGATWSTSGRFGGDLTFNGASNLVTVADSNTIDLTTGMTIEAWIFPTTLSGYRTVILKEIPRELAYGLYAYDNTPRPSVYVNMGSGADPTTAGSGAPPLNAWTHLAATYDGVSLKFYTNGTLVSQRATTGSIVNSSNPLRIGGNNIWGEWFKGDIDEVRVYNRALSAAELQTDMNTPVGGTPPVDTQPPSVSLTSPTAGAVLSSTVTVSASASDDVAVVGVQFLVDGANLGAEVLTPPYSISWDTKTITNGAHSLSAVARDLAGHQTTATAVPVTVSNASDPSQVGSWAAPTELDLVAVNMILLHNGKILMYRGQDAGGSSATIWDPVNNVFTAVPLNSSNIFCSGNVALADGRILIVGGHDTANAILGSADANIFDPVTGQWTIPPKMNFRRWYPSAVTLPDGRVLVTSGATNCFTCIASTPEIYDPVTNSWTKLTSATLSFPYYPFTFVLSDGRVLDAGAGEQPMPTYVLDLTTQAWSTVDSRTLDGGSAAMYRQDKVLKTGTGATTDVNNLPTATTAYVLDMTQPAPAWRQVASMAFPRAYHVTTLLPDGNVLVTCGGRTTEGKNVANAVYEAELWSPATETWKTMSPMVTPRIYHATALLIPDGRVVVAGSGDSYGGPSQTTAEIYSPPYLFKGARPGITAVPALLQYGAGFVVTTPDAASISSVVIMRPGAMTHQFDEDQKYVPLAFTKAAGSLNVQAPVNANLAPSGYYMVFIVNSSGVPSVGSFTRLPSPADDVVPPSTPGSLTANGSVGTASLSWIVSSDNTGIATYNIHRSTVAGFTPAPGNRVAQSVTNSYTDAGLTPGTYYYRVTAQDVAGNISSPSNQASAIVLADTVAPTVSMTAPANGATVTGIATVSAQADDAVGVAGVQFKLDGAVLGSEDLVSPFSMSWNSAAVANGPHSLTAVARDAAGNQTESAAISVTVSNTQTNPAGLVAAYAFSEGIGTSVADASGNGNTGAISGAAWSLSGRFGNALTFNGVNNWVQVADANTLDLTTGMTLEAWVYPTALSGYRTVLLKEIPGELAYGLYAYDNVPRPAVYIRTGGGAAPTTAGSAAPPLNAWTHLATTFDGATLTLYVNGTLVNQRATTGSIVQSANPLHIGGNAVWGEWFTGSIDEVRVYNRALSATEIQNDMTTPVDGVVNPQLVITSPTNNSTINGSTVNITYTTVGDLTGVDHVHFKLDGGPELMDLPPMDGIFQLTNVSAGPHYLDGFLVRANHSKITGTDAATINFTVVTVAPPTVSMTAPANGANVSGSVNIAATASSSVGIAGVAFLLDGAALAAEDVASPFALVWDTTAIANGSHALSARARDVNNVTTTSAVVTVTVANAPPSSTGLVAAYGFNEGIGTSVADASSNGNVGAITGATWTTSGRFGGALTFNGTSNLVTVADSNSIDLSTGMTIEAWVFPTTLSGYRTVLLKEIPGELAYALYAYDSAPRPSVYIRTGSGTAPTTAGSAAPALNAWTHLAATYDGASLKLYVNGALVNQRATTGSMVDSVNPLRIGGNTIWGEWFKGNIDEVRIYNRALSAGEIQTDMNTPVN